MLKGIKRLFGRTPEPWPKEDPKLVPTICVTCGRACVGSELCAALQAQREEDRILDRESERWDGLS